MPLRDALPPSRPPDPPDPSRAAAGTTALAEPETLLPAPVGDGAPAFDMSSGLAAQPASVTTATTREPTTSREHRASMRVLLLSTLLLE
jgi:hypothetical protein